MTDPRQVTWTTPPSAVPEDAPDFIGPRRPANDLNASDLLAPPPIEAAPVSEPAAVDAYPDQPADLEPLGTPSLADPAVERAAWDQLTAFIQAHKDPGTTVVMVDAETFATNS